MALLGIDLGTTNSLICVWQDGQPTLIPNALGSNLTPSVISYDDKSQEIIVGQSAKERLISHPELSVATFKRQMGTKAQITLGDRTFKAEELSALMLKQLKQDAEAYLGCEVAEAVISVPAYFSDAQRSATKIAGELAGLKVERLINEPTAAALAYGLHEGLKEQMFMVIDLGGGTLDVSILDVFDNIVEVRASSGNNFLGGEDFTQALKELFLKQNNLQLIALDKNEQSRLNAHIETLKHTLSMSHEGDVSISLAGRDIQWHCTRTEFETCIQHLIKQFTLPIERALRDSKIESSQLNKVILVGGATRMPWIRGEVSRMFKMLPTSHIDPDEVVARGTAIQAALKARNEALNDVVLTDVCPYTLGVGIVVERGVNQYESGHFLPIIERNMTVPVSREKRLHTVHDNQEQIVCEIFQGESRLTKNNISIGKIQSEVPKDKAGEQFVDIRFTYNINGILEAILKVGTTGKTERLIINNSATNMTPEEIEESLAKLNDIKIHPRENALNKQIIAQLERLYEEHLGDMRAYIAQILQEFENTLLTENEQAIASARNQVLSIVKQIEG